MSDAKSDYVAVIGLIGKIMINPDIQSFTFHVIQKNLSNSLDPNLTPNNSAPHRAPKNFSVLYSYDFRILGWDGNNLVILKNKTHSVSGAMGI